MALKGGNVCFVRPNRKSVRNYSEKDASRIMCYAIKAGGRQKKIEELAISRGCWKKNECDSEKVRQLVRLILESAAAIAISINIALSVYAVLSISVRILKRIPFLRRKLANLSKNTLLLEDALLKSKDITNKAKLINIEMRGG